MTGQTTCTLPAGSVPWALRDGYVRGRGAWIWDAGEPPSAAPGHGYDAALSAEIDPDLFVVAGAHAVPAIGRYAVDVAAGTVTVPRAPLPDRSSLRVAVGAESYAQAEGGGTTKLPQSNFGAAA